MTLGPALDNFPSVFAHYGVSKDNCKDDKDYYEDHKEACDKNLREHYGEDYNGNFASQAIGQSQSSEQNSQVVSGDDTEDSGNNLSSKTKRIQLATQQHKVNLLFLFLVGLSDNTEHVNFEPSQH